MNSIFDRIHTLTGISGLPEGAETQPVTGFDLGEGPDVGVMQIVPVPAGGGEFAKVMEEVQRQMMQQCGFPKRNGGAKE